MALRHSTGPGSRSDRPSARESARVGPTQPFGVEAMPSRGQAQPSRGPEMESAVPSSELLCNGNTWETPETEPRTLTLLRRGSATPPGGPTSARVVEYQPSRSMTSASRWAAGPAVGPEQPEKGRDRLPSGAVQRSQMTATRSPGTERPPKVNNLAATCINPCAPRQRESVTSGGRSLLRRDIARLQAGIGASQGSIDAQLPGAGPTCPRQPPPR